MEIKILGPGCAKCEKTAKLVQEVVAETGAQARVVKVTDMMQIAGSGVVSTPAVMVDGDIKSTGKVPKKDEIAGWLK
ncbi:MAG: TM0996/MTH895 family glutaredoxin-like protein [Deltaproteobacteria bacterium]|jgi:small redox-active disulfide protein 2|nr:TM0996/MTH895 family glutaredoxin-like protein [Deltaproteobacteria bacterium]